MSDNKYVWIRGSTGGSMSYHRTIFDALYEVVLSRRIGWTSQVYRDEQVFLSRMDRDPGEDGWLVHLVNRFVVLGSRRGEGDTHG
jgi:hypothetical protein